MGEKFKSYANSFQTVIDLSLDRIETMLGFLGNPQHLTHTDIIAILATIIPCQEHIIRHYADKCNGG